MPQPFKCYFCLNDWLEYLLLNKTWLQKKFDNPMKKAITIMWAIWTHRTNVIFIGAKCNPASVIESARKIFNDISIYAKYGY